MKTRSAEPETDPDLWGHWDTVRKNVWFRLLPGRTGEDSAPGLVALVWLVQVFLQLAESKQTYHQCRFWPGSRSKHLSESQCGSVVSLCCFCLTQTPGLLSPPHHHGDEQTSAHGRVSHQSEAAICCYICVQTAPVLPVLTSHTNAHVKCQHVKEERVSSLLTQLCLCWTLQ